MKRIIIPIAAILFFALSACEDIIEVKLNDEDLNLYAVEAKITTEDNPSVFFYTSSRVENADPYRGISGATVIISDNGQPAKSIQLVESATKKGLYLVPQSKTFLGERGKEYSVSVKTGETTFTATDKLSQVEPIDSIRVQPSMRGDKQFLGVFTYGNEPKGVGNYYKWDLYFNDKLQNKAENLVVASDELVDGNYVEGLEVFTDFHDPNKADERKLKIGDKVQVKQTSISAFAYNYYMQVLNQSQSGGMFSVPTANIVGNFKSNNDKMVLGLFTAHDVSISNVVIVDEQIDSQLKVY